MLSATLHALRACHLLSIFMCTAFDRLYTTKKHSYCLISVSEGVGVAVLMSVEKGVQSVRVVWCIKERILNKYILKYFSELDFFAASAAAL